MKAKKVYEYHNFEQGGDSYEKLNIGRDVISIKFVSEDDDDIIDTAENILYPFTPHTSLQKAQISLNGIISLVDVPKEIAVIVDAAAMKNLSGSKISKTESKKYKKWVNLIKSSYPYV